jgi:sulfide:quinone oxidoreductase
MGTQGVAVRKIRYRHEMRVLVLGAGFGGLELSARLSDHFGGDIDVVLIDQSEGFIFGFSKLDVMFGRKSASDVFHPYADLDKPGLRFVQTAIRSIDPAAKHIESDAGPFDADILVVALGADLDPSATPGLVEAGHEFYTVPGAMAVREVLSAFDGGHVIVGVTSTPFKCPPAPSETALLLHDYLTERGIRDGSSISLVMPMGVPIPPSPTASEALLVAFAERGISWHPEALIRGLDPERRVAQVGDGTEMPFDLFLGVPVHRVPAVVEESGLTVDGWVAVNPLTLETAFPDVYAVGDVTSVGTPKAGVFAEGQASVVAEQIISRASSGSTPATYDGQGTCYLEFGHDLVARVSITFLSGAAPVGALEGPSQSIAADKVTFGTTRVQRWFDRSWTEDERRPS